MTKEETGMPAGAMIFLGGVLVIFAVLDVIMLVSLVMPGDERGQVIVWKASAFTLSAVMGGNLLDVIVNFVKARPMVSNPFVELEVAALLYFVSLMYYRKRHGG